MHDNEGVISKFLECLVQHVQRVRFVEEVFDRRHHEVAGWLNGIEDGTGGRRKGVR